ncbi:hypothetical protein M404DRAFT_30836 [Pisolithus tinctorius Marx 270]|uniref:CCHC-type domain-containing protein n=1 Tax=Pisolithus tinctorius Marx 270 TaxID=870435 RepID=A0A0C3ND39_PISTI|nr:hypothetical protein M404DRAFT_30836 [Pisolithus tinctorius Marx 270]
MWVMVDSGPSDQIGTSQLTEEELDHDSVMESDGEVLSDAGGAYMFAQVATVENMLKPSDVEDLLEDQQGFTSGILSNLFTQSLAMLSTPIPPVPTVTLPVPPPPPQIMMSGSLLKATTGTTAIKATELKIEIYDTDTKKVVYALSYMKKGVARSWAATFQKMSLEKTPPSFGSFANFTKDFKNSFTSSDTAEDIALIEFFSQGLKPFIANHIHMMETTPTKITEWYTQSQKFNTKWRKVNEFSGKKEKRMFYPKNNLSEEKDPNAMDMDGVRLSQEERDHHIKEGRCLSCRNKGHLSQECPDKGKTPQKKGKKICKVVEIEESNNEEKVAGPSIALVNIARALGKDF